MCYIASLEDARTSRQSVDLRIAAITECDPVVQRLMTVLGPVTATAFVTMLGDVMRLASAHQVEAYLGLMPREASSGERQHRARSRKRERSGLYGCVAFDACRPYSRRGRLVWQRRGKRVAFVAPARRLAGIFYTMRCNGTVSYVHRAVRHATLEATAQTAKQSTAT